MSNLTQGKVPPQPDSELRKSPCLPSRPLLRSEISSEALRVQVRVAAISAAASLYEGSFPRSEADIEEFLACAADLEDWINRD